MEYKEGYGINFSKLAKETKENTELLPVLNGQEVADQAEKVFDKLSPDVACKLVESNVVLTMAGLKPHSDSFIDVQDPKEAVRLKTEVEKLNNLLNNPVVRFRLIGKPFEYRDKKLTQMIGVDSLIGWERITKTTKIPGVPGFNSKNGWEAFEKWYPEMVEGVKKAQEQGLIPANYDVISGLMHGYPDQAIYDFEDWQLTGRSKKIQESNIPYTGIYKEAQPNYDYYPEHAEDPQIKENIQAVGQILKEFYESEWHKKVSPNLEFRRDKEY